MSVALSGPAALLSGMEWANYLSSGPPRCISLSSCVSSYCDIRLQISSSLLDSLDYTYSRFMRCSGYLRDFIFNLHILKLFLYMAWRHKYLKLCSSRDLLTASCWPQPQVLFFKFSFDS